MDYLVGDVPSKSAKPLIALTWRCTARHLGKPGRVAWSQGLMLKWPRMVSKLFSMKKKSAINFQCWRKLWQWGCNLVFLSEKKGETHILVERTFEATVWFFFFLQFRSSVKIRALPWRWREHKIGSTVSHLTSEGRSPQEGGCRHIQQPVTELMLDKSPS